MNIGCDIDGCLANFNLSYGRLYEKLTGKYLFPEDWEEKLKKAEFPTVWEWETEAGYTKEDSSRIWKVITTDEKFWSRLDGIGNAAETIRNLNKLANEGNGVYFITNRMGVKAKLQTEKWLYGMGMDYPTVCMVSHTNMKVPVIKALGIDFFVDDKRETIIQVAEATSQQTPFHLYCVNTGYNQGQYPVSVKVVSTVADGLKDAGLWRD